MGDDRFLIPDVDALRRKMGGLTGLWRRRWEHFLACTAAEQRSPNWYSSMAKRDMPTAAAFAWVVTRDPKWKPIARRDLLWMEEQYPNLRLGAFSDRDTWVYAAPMLRRAIALDWIWNSGALSPEEQARFAEFFITDALKYSYIVLRHRVPPHANNQGLAMGLNLVTIGYLFGVKHGRDARAQRLLEFGLPHLLQQVAYLPPDGYSGEGTTYLAGVEAPLMSLASAVLEASTGEDVYDRRFAPNANTVAGVLQLPARIIPPSGVLPGWDHYHFQFGTSACTLAYLAHRTGDPSYYDYVMFGPGWERSGSPAWMRDGHIWQWLWMPDPQKAQQRADPPYFDRPWVEPHVAGTLLSRDGNLHLFQMWDVADVRPVRRHMNPNSLIIEAWQSILTVDGSAIEGFPLSEDPSLSFQGRRVSSRADASVAAHSCVTVDGLRTLGAPKGYTDRLEEVTTGRLLRHEIGDSLQMVSADVTDFYSHAVDITSMVRTSAMVDERFWVIHDRIRAESEHEYAWQLVLRQGAVKAPYGARLRTQEHVVLDVVAVEGQDELVDIAGYPDNLEKSCHHYRQHRRGRDVEIVTVLVPQLGRQELADWTEGWQGRWDPEDEGLAHAWQEQTSRDGWEPMSLRDAFLHVDIFPTVSTKPGGIREEDVPPDRTVVWFMREIEIPEDGQLLLELPRGSRLQAWLDDRELTVPRIGCEPPFADISDVCRPGTTQRLTLRISRQGHSGPEARCRLHRRIEVNAPDVKRSGNTLTVTFGGRTQAVPLDRIRAAADAEPAERPHGGDDPVDVATQWAQKLIDYAADEKAGDEDGSPASRRRACIRALVKANAANIEPMNQSPSGTVQGRHRTLNIEPRSTESRSLPSTFDVRRSMLDVRTSEKALCDMLDDPDWVTRALAVEALGALRSQRAVEPILAVLQGETHERVETEGYEPCARLKEMCIEALGRLGDASAVPALVDCLDTRWFYGVRRLAAQSLGEIGGAVALPALEQAVNDPDPEAAGAARRSLGTCRKGLPR